MSKLMRRPSPALVIACVSLFVSLGGVSYGVATGFIDSREIKNSTIRTKDVRNNDLRGSDIRKDTVGGADVNEATLGRVPSAARADSAATAGDAATVGGLGPSVFARAQQEAPRVVDTPGQPQFLGTFDHSAITCLSCPPVSFWKDTVGVVHLAGSVTGPQDGTAFSLPPGYRPNVEARALAAGDYVSDAGSVTIVRVKENGEVVIVGAPSTNQVALDGITFRAEK